MFNQAYNERTRKISKYLLEIFNHKYFMSKAILDLGAGHGDIGATFFRLGGTITAVDARQSHLDSIKKKYPNINTTRLDLDGNFVLNARFDITLCLGTLCHLKNYENVLKHACAMSRDLILETAVIDSDHIDAYADVQEHKSVFDLAFNGVGARPSAAKIEQILSKCGMHFIRVDSPELNHDKFVYDWNVTNTNKSDLSYRRFWIASKNSNVIDQISKRVKVISSKGSASNIIDIKPVATPLIVGRGNQNKQVAKTWLGAKQSRVEPENIFKSKTDYVATIVDNKKFVIVIPSYKNESWAEKNIVSVLNQNYEDFRIIFTDDLSPDNTFDIVQNIVNNHKNKDKCTLIKNEVRKGALENLYDMIHSCSDEEIILTVDGDDWLPDPDVLYKLNNIYQNENIWLTYGQYKNYPDNGIGVASAIPDHVIKSNNYRQYKWCASHLRTFYSWLFKRIKKEDLMYEGKFMSMTWDLAIMFPMLEMSAGKSRYINDVLYIYNLTNPINDHKVNVKLQQSLDKLVRFRPKYNATQKPVFPKREQSPNDNGIKVGLLLIATGKYDQFINQLVESADKYFMNDNKYNVNYFIFTDKDVELHTNRNYKIINIQHKDFPYASMDRFKHFANNSNELSKMEYLYYIDVDCKFVDNINEDIIGDLVGVRHCGYYNGGGTFETNVKSAFFVDPKKYKYYYGGGFSGGKSEEYLKLSKWCYHMIEADLANSIMPIFHDETAINKYFLDHPPTLSLSPSYHYPQSNIDYYMKLWGSARFEPKIILLDKNHNEVRS